jgi:DNA-binding NarL/FixJ family response regulator
MDMTDRVVNLLIGDAQPRVRFGLRVLLEQHPGWHVTGEAENARALLDQIHLGCPDLVLLDWELPGMPAQELLAVIRRACPRLGVVFMSGGLGGEIAAAVQCSRLRRHGWKAFELKSKKYPPGDLCDWRMKLIGRGL